MAEVSMQRHGRAKQLVVFFGPAGIGTRGGWGADAVLRACCKVVCRPRGTDQRRGRVVLVDEHRTTRVSSAENGQQPCESRLRKRRATRPADWKPPEGQVHHRLVRLASSQQRDEPVGGLMWCPVVAPRKPPQAPRSSQAATQAAASEPWPSTPLPAKRSKRTKAEPAAEPTKGKGKGKAARAKPAPQPGRWLDRDCNAALNMQRIGESKWRPLELCYWPDQGALPAKGKEYPGLGVKKSRTRKPNSRLPITPRSLMALHSWPHSLVKEGIPKLLREVADARYTADSADSNAAAAAATASAAQAAAAAAQRTAAAAAASATIAMQAASAASTQATACKPGNAQNLASQAAAQAAQAQADAAAAGEAASAAQAAASTTSGGAGERVRVLLAQRPQGKDHAGLWEFPGGKVEEGETPEAALVRELQEELGLQVCSSDLTPLSFVSWPYPGRFHLLMPLYSELPAGLHCAVEPPSPFHALPASTAAPHLALRCWPPARL
ncbi:hypothetical protein QJQ45_018609 [Haematococcus lacustris]|nr:hypothetical protein QJQ45_018609 [Haematococcus lacustris]